MPAVVTVASLLEQRKTRSKGRSLAKRQQGATRQHWLNVRKRTTYASRQNVCSLQRQPRDCSVSHPARSPVHPGVPANPQPNATMACMDLSEAKKLRTS